MQICGQTSSLLLTLTSSHVEWNQEIECTPTLGRNLSCREVANGVPNDELAEVKKRKLLPGERWKSKRKEMAMLVLSRKKNESIVINNDITIVVVEIRGDKVRLGVEAPKEVPVHRREVYEAIQRNNSAATDPKSAPSGDAPTA